MTIQLNIKQPHKPPTLRSKAQLHKIIVSQNGTPDYLAINLYWDTFRSWYNPKKTYTKDGNVYHLKKVKTKGIYLNYAKLSKAHGCSKETIRKKIVKLEKLGLINRSFQHRDTVTTKSYNQLIIYVWKQTPCFFNEYGIDIENTELNPYTSHNYIAEKHNVVFASQDIQSKALISKDPVQQLEDTKELRKPFSKEKDRSMESNFCKNISSGIKKSLSFSKKPKTMINFYPLSDLDVSTLQSDSGREFTKTAMNEIILDMSKKVTATFWSKKGFIAYMSKALRYEMRDAVKVSNDNFRITANINKEEHYIKTREQFLDSIETKAIMHVCPENQLKAKLANTLNPDTAYTLLTNYRKCYLKESEFIIRLSKDIELSELAKATILSQAQATYERFDNGEWCSIESLNISVA